MRSRCNGCTRCDSGVRSITSTGATCDGARGSTCRTRRKRCIRWSETGPMANAICGSPVRENCTPGFMRGDECKSPCRLGGDTDAKASDTVRLRKGYRLKAHPYPPTEREEFPRPEPKLEAYADHPPRGDAIQTCSSELIQGEVCGSSSSMRLHPRPHQTSSFRQSLRVYQRVPEATEFPGQHLVPIRHNNGGFQHSLPAQRHGTSARISERLFLSVALVPVELSTRLKSSWSGVHIYALGAPGFTWQQASLSLHHN
jgi:hypothetical protein